MKEIDYIIDTFCKDMDVTRDLVMSESKSLHICRVRYMIYAFLHNELNMTGHSLAKMFGRDRINILRGIRVMKGHMKCYPDIRDKYFEIVRKIEGSN